jgi:hypothetical protein
LIVRINAYNQDALMNDAKYIELDVHQATISVAILDAAGKLVMEAIRPIGQPEKAIGFEPQIVTME